METSGKIQLNEDGPNHHDNYQEDKGHHPNMGRFLTTIFHLTSKVLYSLEPLNKFQFNEDDPNHQDPNQKPQGSQEDQGCPSCIDRLNSFI